jgi:DtxR family manganese transport transcriptional regulator
MPNQAHSTKLLGNVLAMHRASDCSGCFDFAVCTKRDLLTPRRSEPVSALAEDYVLLLRDLGGNAGKVKPGDLASRLNVSVGTVTRALQRLTRDGYVEVEKGKSATLTAKGLRLASDVEYRRDTIVRFLTAFGVSPCVATRDANGLKHFLGPESLRVFVSLFTEREAFKSQAQCTTRCFCPTGSCAIPHDSNS